jgi:hypothetical protein
MDINIWRCPNCGWCNSFVNNCMKCGQPQPPNCFMEKLQIMTKFAKKVNNDANAKANKTTSR